MTNYRGERPRQSTPLRNRCVKAWSVLCVLGSIGTHSVHGLKPSSSTKPTPPIAFSESLDAPEVSRRRLLFSSGAVAVAAAATAFLPSDAASAARAKGAAELDLEFYVRDLVGGNKKEGNIEQSKNGPPVPPPRRLEGPLVPMLLNKDCTSDCVSVQALIEELQQEQKNSGRAVSSKEDVERDIQQRVDAIRERTKRSFYSKAPWGSEDIADQYYFDFTMYALWKTAAELIDVNPNRDRFMRNVGRLLLARLESEKMMTTPQKGSSPSSDKDNGLLVSSVPSVMDLLNIFKSSNYCKNFRIRSSDNADIGDDEPFFDDLDDESLSMVGTANCLVSIYEPTTLGASLQINGENSRFAPDFVGTTLAAVWETHGGIRSTWDVFFVDPEYRPNPKDYFPNEQLLQITLSKK
mmetsp:Transcript_27925/g.57924  ORF Transcript_27925/g.57924 Transcript_27925/m.57924 type:complete len:408 (+) Transcript_27925:188-1411(+)